MCLCGSCSWYARHDLSEHKTLFSNPAQATDVISEASFGESFHLLDTGEVGIEIRS